MSAALLSEPTVKHKRINNDVFDRDAHPGGAFDDLLGYGKAFLGGLGNAVIVHGQTDDSRAALLDQRQDCRQLVSPRR